MCESMSGGIYGDIHVPIYPFQVEIFCFDPNQCVKFVCISSLGVAQVPQSQHDLSHDLRHKGLQHAAAIAGGIQLVNVPAIASAPNVRIGFSMINQL